eukprot:gnl/MRDRNA2_/MRDRNA2_105413_c0_seq1.p1 gnl/MRDRNA2_/MRDRNA2_105413_c0~~gnl/MRDRNA2_/MRDRNA2_105413_c0_seq1.p1  ORF type:complete len:337 (+),score=65.92 gnl/MRDRNA2_/MRDRNA2_105413_c0_seq1:41-1051(+)
MDPYAVLGVHRGASLQELRAAHKKAVLRTHPDKAGTHGSTASFQAVQDAFQQIMAAKANAPTVTTSTAWGDWSQVQPHEWTQQQQPDWHYAHCSDESIRAAEAELVGSQTSQSWDPWLGVDLGASTGIEGDPWDAYGTDGVTWWDETASYWQDPHHASASSSWSAWDTGGQQAWSGSKPEQFASVSSKSKERSIPHSTALVAQSDSKGGVLAQRQPEKRRRGGKGEVIKRIRTSGVYGFSNYREGAACDLPSSSESEDEEELRRRNLAQMEHSMNVSLLGGWSVPTQVPDFRQAPATVQKRSRMFKCVRHNKARPEECLTDDEEGNPVCKFGYECP